MVTQYYEAEVVSEYVIRGNTAVLKCNIPSFVSDFVRVEAWVGSDGSLYSYDTNYGNVNESAYFCSVNSCRLYREFHVQFRAFSLAFLVQGYMPVFVQKLICCVLKVCANSIICQKCVILTAYVKRKSISWRPNGAYAYFIDKIFHSRHLNSSYFIAQET